MRHIPVADPDFSGRGRLQAGDHAQRCSFSAAGWPHQHQELAIGNFQIHWRHSRLGAKHLADFAKTDPRHVVIPLSFHSLIVPGDGRIHDAGRFRQGFLRRGLVVQNLLDGGLDLLAGLGEHAQ